MAAAKKQTTAAAVKEKPKAKAAEAVQGHNSGIDPKREAVFIREFANIKAAEVDMAETKGQMSGIYKRLETAGFSKEHVAFAKSLEKKNVAEVIADFEMKIAIARIMGHAAGRQLDMLDKDRTPIEDIAYLDGLAAGKMGRSAANPYGMETIAGQRFQAGMNDGTAFRNKAINEAVNGKEGEQLIKGGDDGDGSEDQGGEDGDNDGVGDDNADGSDGVSGSDTETGSDDGSAESGSEGDDDDWDNADPAKKSA